MAHIAAVAPVFNEEANVAELARRLGESLSKVSEDYQIVLVDDGSRDGTWAAIRAACEADPKLTGLRFSRNFGQHAAITAGIDAADGDWVVVLDGDLQDRPEVIPDLYAKAQEGFDVVFVQRDGRPESKLYMAAQKVFYWTLQSLTNTNYDSSQGNFSIIARKVADDYRRFAESGRFYGGLIEWLGYRRGTLLAQHGERFAGTPAYNLSRRLKFAKDIILSFSTRPLYLALGFGFVVTLFAFFFATTILIRAMFFGYATQGWASIMVTLYFLGGVQMLMTGLNGLYIGRISDEVKGRRLYVVGDRLGAGRDEQ